MTPNQTALVHEWTLQVRDGHLTDAGLLALRARLDPTSGEFEPWSELDRLRLDVNAELARRIGVAPDEMPGMLPWDDVLTAWILADTDPDPNQDQTTQVMIIQHFDQRQRRFEEHR